ncbi:MAG: hypothetical protein M1315_03190 [Candidatus Thermoplasmatota archaeon]|nr:hypothetical protein [Candidatus Thermoplasmatota archaeon]
MDYILSIFNGTIGSHLPYGLNSYSWLVYPLLFLIDGFLVGWAIRKGAFALILMVIAAFIAAFIGISFIPNFSLSAVFQDVYDYIVQKVEGTITFSVSIVLFFIGAFFGLRKK